MLWPPEKRFHWNANTPNSVQDSCESHFDGRAFEQKKSSTHRTIIRLAMMIPVDLCGDKGPSLFQLTTDRNLRWIKMAVWCHLLSLHFCGPDRTERWMSHPSLAASGSNRSSLIFNEQLPNQPDYFKIWAQKTTNRSVVICCFCLSWDGFGTGQVKLIKRDTHPMRCERVWNCQKK